MLASRYLENQGSFDVTALMVPHPNQGLSRGGSAITLWIAFRGSGSGVWSAKRTFS
jgi:hypothetical protein